VVRWGGNSKKECINIQNCGWKINKKIIAEKSESSQVLFFGHGVTRESGQECRSAACIPRMHMHLIKRVEQARGSLRCGSRVQVHGGLERKG
jgi:hypothetical protein